MDTLRALISPSPSSSEAAVYEPIAKRPKLPPNKVCFVCLCSTNKSGDGYAIFILDLNSGANTINAADEFIPRAPTLRLGDECFESSDASFAFCVLNSTLYMIESGNLDTRPERKKVFTYDLSSSLDDVSTNNNFSLRVDKSMVGKAPDMLQTKKFPFATPTPDGKKILVFSNRIGFNLNYDEEIGDGIDIELYDPATRSWQKLPGMRDCLRRNFDRSIAFAIKAFTFIKKSVLLLQTEEYQGWDEWNRYACVSPIRHLFALNLDSPDQGWERWDHYAGVRAMRRDGRFFIIGDDELCVTPYGARDITEENRFDDKGRFENESDDDDRFFYFPLSSVDSEHGFRNFRVHGFRNFPVMTIFDDNVGHGECNFCVIQTRMDEECTRMDEECTNLVVDVCSSDLIKYREDKQKVGHSARLDTSIVKSFKFVVKECGLFLPLNVFSI